MTELEKLNLELEPLALDLTRKYAASGSRMDVEDWVAKYHPEQLEEFKRANEVFEQVLLERRARKAQQRKSEKESQE